MPSVRARFVGGPLNGQEQILPSLDTPYFFNWPRLILHSVELEGRSDMRYDEHRYDLDLRDYEARREEIDQGDPVLYVHSELEEAAFFLAAVGTMISFEEAYRRVNEVTESAPIFPTIEDLTIRGHVGGLFDLSEDDDQQDWHVADWMALTACLPTTSHELQQYLDVAPFPDPPHHLDERVPCHACGADWVEHPTGTSMVHDESCTWAQTQLIFHTVQAGWHMAPNCDELPEHERCWPQGESDPLDPHGYTMPLSDEAGGVSAEDLVPGIEEAIREWNQVKEEITDDE